MRIAQWLTDNKDLVIALIGLLAVWLRDEHRSKKHMDILDPNGHRRAEYKMITAARKDAAKYKKTHSS